MIIGVDFDNTIVNYDDILYSLVLERGLIPLESKKSKKYIRDRIRQLPNGEIEWQKLQTIIYGPRMKEAKLINGVCPFFESCRENRIKIFIVSHKTEYASYDESKTNLRATALSWMENNGFFEKYGFGLSKKDIFFEYTRANKIQRIIQLQCTHFIDDLEETYHEPSFPEQVEKILFSPHLEHGTLIGVKVFKDWTAIGKYFFNGNK